MRAYKTTDVKEEKLRKVLEAARLSPSASNCQDWKFIIVKNNETKKKLAKAAFGQSFIGEAPIAIVACGTEPKSIIKSFVLRNLNEKEVNSELFFRTSARLKMLCH